MITDPKTNKTYKVTRRNITNKLLEILKDRVSDMNIIGFFIAGRGKSGKVDKRTLMSILRDDSYEIVGASKAKLKSAFGKSMKNKVSSRQLLNKFVKLVA